MLFLTGSKKERDIFKKARKKLGLEDKFDPTAPTPKEIEQKPDISGKFKMAGPLEVGKDLNLILVLTNLQSEVKSVQVNMTAWSTLYTRRPVREIWKDSLSVSLSPEEGNFSNKIITQFLLKVINKQVLEDDQLGLGQSETYTNWENSLRTILQRRAWGS